jgi:hypothetical protein
MGGNGSSEEAPNYDDKIFGPNGRLMSISDMLKIQEDLNGKYPKLSDATEKEKKALMPKLMKVYDLIDAWRSDVDLEYRHALTRMRAAADHNARVPEQILGSLVSLLCLLPGLKSGWDAVQIGNLLKTSAMQKNDMAAFGEKGFNAAKFLYVIGSNAALSYKQTSTFEGLLLKASENMRALLCSPTEEQWKSLRLLSGLEIDTNLYLYHAIRTAMVKHTLPFVYGYIFSTNFKFRTECLESAEGSVSLFGTTWLVMDNGIISEIEDLMKINPQLFWEGTKFKRCDKNCEHCYKSDDVYHPRMWRGMIVYAFYRPHKHVYGGSWCTRCHCSNCCACGKYRNLLD